VEQSLKRSGYFLIHSVTELVPRSDKKCLANESDKAKTNCHEKGEHRNRHRFLVQPKKQNCAASRNRRILNLMNMAVVLVDGRESFS
jgi:hypothetical protein